MDGDWVGLGNQPGERIGGLEGKERWAGWVQSCAMPAVWPDGVGYDEMLAVQKEAVLRRAVPEEVGNLILHGRTSANACLGSWLQGLD